MHTGCCEIATRVVGACKGAVFIKTNGELLINTGQSIISVTELENLNFYLWDHLKIVQYITIVH